MQLLPAKPEFSTVREREDPDGLTLYWWPRPFSWFGAVFGVLFLSAWLFGWLCGWLTVLESIVANFRFHLLLWWCLWTFGGFMVVRTIRASIKIHRPESIRLGSGGIRYDPGPRRTDPDRPYDWYRILMEEHAAPRARVVEATRVEITGFVLDWEKGPTSAHRQRQRLSIAMGKARIEIAECLSDREREWLSKVLNGWYRAESEIPGK